MNYNAPAPIDEEAPGEAAAAESSGQKKKEPFYKGKHPVAGFFHAIFKILAVVVWVITIGGNFAGASTILQIVLVLLFASDFWTVKNITGRLMVGLRWWNSVREDGTSVWYFESLPDMSGIDNFDSTFFWMAVIGHCVVWVVFTALAVLTHSPMWIPVFVLGVVLGGANFVGYLRCRKDVKKSVTRFVAGRVIEAAKRNPDVVANSLWRAAGAATGQSAAPDAPAAAPRGGAPAGSSSDDYGFAPSGHTDQAYRQATSI
eukprot:NODE_3520_length_917_cov_10.160138_g2927_i0.p1 GENE.NODE_3520_length_917_cov_10.160138_g2927_i0~~NODE_3520_length_917_cov_10.160138_g2927_i0.p1  ORF type:complete len:259 (+),score=40.36 NODE_3520_length_917_cov_10.160138_g2927_i0:87-863(+)